VDAKTSPPVESAPADDVQGAETLPGTDIAFARDVPVPMRDGQVLRANVFAPRQPGRYPVIINVGPYGKDVSLAHLYPSVWSGMVRRNPAILSGSDARDIAWEVPDPRRWVPDGYVLVHADSRGAGRSAGLPPGRWRPSSPGTCPRSSPGTAPRTCTVTLPAMAASWRIFLSSGGTVGWLTSTATHRASPTRAPGRARPALRKPAGRGRRRGPGQLRR
jgi:hypothetical protein